MIVVDTNVIAYYFIKGKETDLAESVFKVDSVWLAPQLWRSEFRNILALYLRQELLSLPKANEIMARAECLIQDNFALRSSSILDLVANSQLSAYDAEFVAVARKFALQLITNDKKIIASFPEIAVSMQNYSISQ